MDPGLWRDRIILDEFIVIVHSMEWDVSLFNSLRWRIYIFNSVVNTKSPANFPTDAAPQFL